MASYRVAVVARAPNAGDPVDQTIEDFATNLLAAQVPVLRATNMDELDQRIKDHWADPARNNRLLSLLLCGHGTSGLLHLGSSWMQPQASAPMAAFQDPYFLVDTNPWSLGKIGDHRDKFEQISLVACYVGSIESDGYAINGRTLAYTLCEHLHTKVIAAMDWVDPSEVATGDYVPVNHLKPSTWTWQTNSEPRYADPNLGQHPQVVGVGPFKSFRIVEVVGSRIPTARRANVPTNIDIRGRRLADPRLVHATPELLLKVLDGPVPATAEMYGNGRVIRVGGVFYAVHQPGESSQKLGQALAL